MQLLYGFADPMTNEWTDGYEFFNYIIFKLNLIRYSELSILNYTLGNNLKIWFNLQSHPVQYILFNKLHQ
jgi:hypothetical protein